MISLVEAMLLLRGWEGRRVRVVFKSDAVKVGASGTLSDVVGTKVAFLITEGDGFEVDLEGCAVDFSDRAPETREFDEAIGAIREDFNLTVCLFKD